MVESACFGEGVNILSQVLLHHIALGPRSRSWESGGRSARQAEGCEPDCRSETRVPAISETLTVRKQLLEVILDLADRIEAFLCFADNKSAFRDPASVWNPPLLAGISQLLCQEGVPLFKSSK